MKHAGGVTAQVGAAETKSVAPTTADDLTSPLLVVIYVSTIMIYAVAIVIHASSYFGDTGPSTNVAAPVSQGIIASVAFEVVVAFVCVVVPVYLYVNVRSPAQATGDASGRVWVPQHPKHPLVPKRTDRNLCDLCGKEGTDFRCSAGCDYDACADCCKPLLAQTEPADKEHAEATRPSSEDDEEVSGAAEANQADLTSVAEQWLDMATSTKASSGPPDQIDGAVEQWSRTSGGNGGGEMQEEALPRTVSAGDAAAGLPGQTSAVPRVTRQPAWGHTPPESPHGLRSTEPPCHNTRDLSRELRELHEEPSQEEDAGTLPRRYNSGFDSHVFQAYSL